MRIRLAVLLLVLAACQPEQARPSPSPTGTPIASPTTASPPVEQSALRAAVIQRGPGASFGVRLEGTDEPFIAFDTDNPGIVSPDGRKLAFFVRDKGDYRQALQVFDGVTGDVREIVRLQDETPSGYGWSEDSAGLAYGARSNRFESGGVDPPATYTAIRLVELSRGSPREIARVQSENLVVLGWARAEKLVLARSGWAEGSSRAIGVADDSGVTRATAGTPVAPDSMVPSPDRTASAGRFWSGSSDPADPRRMINNSGITVWQAGSNIMISERRTDRDSGVAAFAYRPNSNDLISLLFQTTPSGPATSIEIWPDHGRGTPHRIWTIDDLYSQGSQGFFLAADGAAAYVSFRYPGRPVRNFKVDLGSGQATAVTFPTQRTSYVGTMLVTDAAVARHRRSPVASALSRGDAIARVRALDRNLVRVDRIEAKLGSAAEVQRMVVYRTKLEVPADVPVWVVAVSGDVRAFTDTETFRLSWGAWFIDGRDGSVLGFDGDPRPGWPSFWDDLTDRAP